MKVKDVVIAISASLAKWMATRYPDKDVETTLFEELSPEENGLVLTVEDEEFEIRVERADQM